MRVLLVHNRYRSDSPSGEDRVVDQEEAALAARGHAIERFERSSDEIARRSAARKAVVPLQIVWNDKVRRSLRHAIQTFRPDVVHVHNTFPLLSASVLRSCRTERVPVVVTVHNYRLVCPSGTLFRDGEVCHDCVGRFPVSGVRHGCYRDSALATIPLTTALLAHRRAWRTMVSAYVFISRSERDIIAADGLPSERLFVKPNLVPAMPATAQATQPRIVYAGRLTEAKGLPLLMKAWDRHTANRHGGDLELSIAGSGPLEKEVAAWAAARRSVNWLGMLSRESCASLVAGGRAVVVPSQWEETFGLVAVEAMAAGVPPVAARHGSFPELITDGVDGVLFTPGDADALAQVFTDVEVRPHRYQTLGRAARDAYERKFDPEANVDALLQIYEFATKNPVP